MFETVLIVIIIIGLVFWALGHIPMPDPIRTIATIALAVIAIIYLLRLL